VLQQRDPLHRVARVPSLYVVVSHPFKLVRLGALFRALLAALIIEDHARPSVNGAVAGAD
jgi:hypothetical protein